MLSKMCICVLLNSVILLNLVCYVVHALHYGNLRLEVRAMILLMVRWVVGSISHGNATVKCIVQTSVPQMVLKRP